MDDLEAIKKRILDLEEKGNRLAEDLKKAQADGSSKDIIISLTSKIDELYKFRDELTEKLKKEKTPQPVPVPVGEEDSEIGLGHFGI